MKYQLDELTAGLDWELIEKQLHELGYATVSEFLSKEVCNEIVKLYDHPLGYRKTVIMERHRFGLGEYKYFDYPLPDVIAQLRSNIYPFLVPTANLWMSRLGIDTKFPKSLKRFSRICASNDQCKPTPLLLQYGPGGYNTLHQDLYGDIYFPIQCAIFLNEPGVDYEGGEFVLTQQIPRSQSKAIVLRPKKGDMIIFATNFKPAKGVRGYYRVNIKHGVSEIHRGNRYCLGLIFHDART